MRQYGVTLTKPELVPNRQARQSFTNSGQISHIEEMLADWFGDLLTTLAHPASLDQVLVRIVLLSGGRIGEVLRLRYVDTTWAGFIILRPEKGSRSKVIYDPVTVQFLPKLLSDPLSLIFPYSYKQALRIFHKYSDMPIVLWPHKHRPTIHLMRYGYIAYMHSRFNLSDLELQDIIGHNSSRSTNYYLKRFGHG